MSDKIYKIGNQILKIGNKIVTASDSPVPSEFESFYFLTYLAVEDYF